MTTKHDSEKLRYDLVPVKALKAIVQVLGCGAAKYGDNNWVTVPTPRRRYYAACQRHLQDWWDGEELDKETGVTSLAHAGCCILFLIILGRYGDNVDSDLQRPEV